MSPLFFRFSPPSRDVLVLPTLFRCVEEVQTDRRSLFLLSVFPHHEIFVEELGCSIFSLFFRAATCFFTVQLLFEPAVFPHLGGSGSPSLSSLWSAYKKCLLFVLLLCNFPRHFFFDPPPNVSPIDIFFLLRSLKRVCFDFFFSHWSSLGYFLFFCHGQATGPRHFPPLFMPLPLHPCLPEPSPSFTVVGDEEGSS